MSISIEAREWLVRIAYGNTWPPPRVWDELAREGLIHRGMKEKPDRTRLTRAGRAWIERFREGQEGLG